MDPSDKDIISGDGYTSNDEAGPTNPLVKIRKIPGPAQKRRFRNC